ncbi:hypothetical protein ABW19_dt0209514 [Dactylella cylindrospora]|nr:hypothetical protein ABW19_dt0209514 [Dactylella cylindrospora]
MTLSNLTTSEDYPYIMVVFKPRSYTPASQFNPQKLEEKLSNNQLELLDNYYAYSLSIFQLPKFCDGTPIDNTLLNIAGYNHTAIWTMQEYLQKLNAKMVSSGSKDRWVLCGIYADSQNRGRHFLEEVPTVWDAEFSRKESFQVFLKRALIGGGGDETAEDGDTKKE